MKDHRQIGKELGLLFFNELAPFGPFWLPKGFIIFKILEKYLRDLYQREGIVEISTPMLVKKALWERSGHWEKFRDNMFALKDGKEELALKPMNCPESALVYQSDVRSYRDLPIRLAEIGQLHRKEVSGAVGGLFRVRQMTMDDLHIYCRFDQLAAELTSVLRQIQGFYKLFGYKGEFFLATKPDKALGSPKNWHIAEKALAASLKAQKIEYKIKPKDGAFYGPKIDINLKDAHNRDWTISTVQVDFAIPGRFELKYIDEHGKPQQPVIVHRSIFGTFERFIGLLLEHTQGAIPVWLAPVQIKVLTVNIEQITRAKKIVKELESAGARAELDDSNESVTKKIRNAEIQKVPYIVVYGENEQKSGKLAVRQRGSAAIKELTVQELVKITGMHTPEV